MILAGLGVIAGKGTLHATLSNGLVSVYKAENNANDSLGIYNGTAQGGLTYNTGKSGSAFIGNAVNAYVELPNNSMNFSGTSFSVNCWIYMNSNTHNEIVNSYYWAGSGNEYGWYLRHYLGNIEAAFVNGTNTRKITSSYSGLYNLWNMITMSKELNGNMLLYINNNLVATYTTTENPSLNTTQYCSLMNLKWLTGNNGIFQLYNKLDEVCIWNRVLTSSEVIELYNLGAGKFYPF